MNAKIWWSNKGVPLKELWPDSPDESPESGFGVLVRLQSGLVHRPIPHIKYWLKKAGDYPNVWNSGEWWFVIKFRFFFLPFISVCYKNRGAYLGFKSYGYDWPSYEKYWGKDKAQRGDVRLAPSVSVRRTRLD